MAEPELFKLSCPAKVILFGEFSVIRGAPAVGTTVNRRMFLDYAKSNKEGERFFPWAQKIIRQIEKRKGIKNLKDSQLSFQCEWLVHEGLGSSSAVALLVEAAADYLEYSSINPTLESFESCKEDLKRAQEGVGSGFDLGLQLFGKSQIMAKGSIEKIDLNIPKNLYLVHTKNKISTQERLKTEGILDRPFLKEIEKSVDAFLKNKDWQKAIEEHFRILKKEDFVDEQVLQAQKEWQSKNWIECLKTTGAGGGDALLVLINEKSKEEWIEDLKKRDWYIQEATFVAPGLRVEK